MSTARRSKYALKHHLPCSLLSTETTAQDKVNIRSTIPAGLRDPDSKIRTAIAMAIAAVANWDWPQEWPGLLEHIVSSIKQGSDPVLGKTKRLCWTSCAARCWLNHAR